MAEIEPSSLARTSDPHPAPPPRELPPPIPRRSPMRWPLHLGLFAATAVAVAFAGSYSWQGVGGSPLDFVRDPALFLPGLPYAALLLSILLAHELGHYFACRAHGIPASLPYFLPGIPFVGTFGAVIRIRGPIPSRNALFDVAAAGPIAGFVVAFPVLIAGLLRAEPITGGFPDEAGTFGSPLVSLLFERWLHGDADLRVDSVYGAAWVGLLVTSLNLFPVGQLDGGHAVYAVSRRAHRFLARFTLAALFLLIAYEAFIARVVPGYVVWLVVLSVLRDRHPRLLDEVTPLSPRRRALAWGLAVLFALTFIPIPVRIPLSWF